MGQHQLGGSPAVGRTSPNCTRSAHRRRTARPPHPRPSHVRRHRRPRNLVNLPACPAPSCGSVENTSRGECTIVMYVLRSQSVGELIGELIGDPRYKTRQNSENQSAGRLLFIRELHQAPTWFALSPSLPCRWPLPRPPWLSPASSSQWARRVDPKSPWVCTHSPSLIAYAYCVAPALTHSLLRLRRPAPRNGVHLRSQHQFILTSNLP